jgi:hypothetical protein
MGHLAQPGKQPAGADQHAEQEGQQPSHRVLLFYYLPP